MTHRAISFTYPRRTLRQSGFSSVHAMISTRRDPSHSNPSDSTIMLYVMSNCVPIHPPPQASYTSGIVMYRVGQNHIYTVYIWYFWLGNHQKYGVYIRTYTVLANPSYVPSIQLYMQAIRHEKDVYSAYNTTQPHANLSCPTCTPRFFCGGGGCSSAASSSSFLWELQHSARWHIGRWGHLDSRAGCSSRKEATG
jgi:hypothetical protein